MSLLCSIRFKGKEKAKTIRQNNLVVCPIKHNTCCQCMQCMLRACVYWKDRVQLTPIKNNGSAFLGNAAVSVIKGVQESSEMCHRCANHKNMEDLMRTAQDIKFAWIEALGYASCIDGSAQDVEESLQQQPTKADLSSQLVYAEECPSMHDRNYGGQPHRDEQGGSIWSPGRRSEAWD